MESLSDVSVPPDHLSNNSYLPLSTQNALHSILFRYHFGVPRLSPPNPEVRKRIARTFLSMAEQFIIQNEGLKSLIEARKQDAKLDNEPGKSTRRGGRTWPWMCRPGSAFNLAYWLWRHTLHGASLAQVTEILALPPSTLLAMVNKGGRSPAAPAPASNLTQDISHAVLDVHKEAGCDPPREGSRANGLSLIEKHTTKGDSV